MMDANKDGWMDDDDDDNKRVLVAGLAFSVAPWTTHQPATPSSIGPMS